MRVLNLEKRIRRLEDRMQPRAAPAVYRTGLLTVRLTFDHQAHADRLGEMVIAKFQVPRQADTSQLRRFDFKTVRAEVERAGRVKERMRKLATRKARIELARKHGYEVFFPRDNPASRGGVE